MVKDNSRTILIILLIISFFFYAYSFASENKAADLLRNVIQQERTKSEENFILMTIVDKNGKEWNRTGHFYTKKKDEENDMSLFYFITPPELANSGVLTIENTSGLHDQWMYVPAYHTVRRIAGGNRSEKYIGTDFYYEDIINIRVEEYDIKILRNENLNGIDIVILEAIPISQRLKKESAYSRTLWWVDPQKKVAHKVEYFDKEGKRLKVLENLNLQHIKDYYLWGKQVLSDVQNNHKTIIEYKERKVDEPIPSDIFTVRYLRRKK